MSESNGSPQPCRSNHLDRLRRVLRSTHLRAVLWVFDHRRWSALRVALTADSFVAIGLDLDAAGKSETTVALGVDQSGDMAREISDLASAARGFAAAVSYGSVNGPGTDWSRYDGRDPVADDG